MQKMIKYIVVVCIATLFIGCTHKAPVTKRSQMILMSQSQELALGEKSYNDTLKKSKVIYNTRDAKRVKEIGYKIARVVNRNDYKWEFNLVENKAQNAFCLPGGKVVVYTGILKAAKNDDQLATVMSHEIAHALARHGAERVSSGMVANGAQLIGNIILGSQAPHLTQSFNIAFGLGTQYGVLLPYGRVQENEADEIGIHLMYQAGYNIYEALNFWKNMSGGKKEGAEFFSTHPNSSTRMANINRVISEIKKSHPRMENSIKNTSSNLGKKIN
ncbi:M48 family metallopeptidase [Arcobacter sp. LA11]|uniref:M48 family metallopeptidase n=1 Tax=Arcobacter sp. LA11 TaxID=1898176 RepID=UPI000A979185|nr:M48 family metallopeptidase [Arcobacter sp. LA11]